MPILTEMNTVSSDTLIQIFAKAPVEGEVKTRLIPHLGPSGAASLYKELAAGTFSRLDCSRHRLQLWCSPDVEHPFFVETGFDRRVQKGTDLGARMAAALAVGLETATRVVLVGTDLPAVDLAYVDRAFRMLNRAEVVLGPAVDGGYGLIGISGEVPGVFEQINWGSREVLEETCSALNRQGRRYSLLPLIWDVDTKEDLDKYDRWRK